MNAAVQHGTKAEKTHIAILEAAEEIFALKGFTAARLEDIADKVGIKRASLVYYYRDKQALYADVLKGVFGGLFDRVSTAFDSPGTLVVRTENTVAAWIDYISERPALPRLLLREIADANPRPSKAILDSVAPFYQMIHKAYLEGISQISNPPSDPIRALGFASIISGTTVFFIAALTALSPSGQNFSLTPAQLAAHKQGVLELVRLLLERGGLKDQPTVRRGKETV